jgi:hypothetical protein
MTLIQKLNDSIITNINIVESENRMCYDYNHLELAENCEVIADEHAIEFADWLDAEETEQLILDLKMVGELPKVPKTKELLQIFKKKKVYENKSNKAV